ncbi:hypothetical protein IWX90DRAFT_426430 [Phyllosticta citrichinensis]|uniref:Secreted protein n=1 Tax=Phyllosticta citrichinensis TaxID=1130410 RepID=A0ABR1XY15_9PEZI
MAWWGAAAGFRTLLVDDAVEAVVCLSARLSLWSSTGTRTRTRTRTDMRIFLCTTKPRKASAWTDGTGRAGESDCRAGGQSLFWLDWVIISWRAAESASERGRKGRVATGHFCRPLRWLLSWLFSLERNVVLSVG